MKHKYKVNAISAAILTSLMATSAFAEEQKASEEKETDIEVIEVKGFRGSLQKAVNDKRFADGVKDAIHAEDVGKSTDQNIADALSRVTGVTVTEEDGEGARISIRGAGPSQNQISMNGVALTSGLSSDGSNADAANDNSVDLSTFSSDILSSIEVFKTSAADHDEGSLGGSVVLNTVKPLSLRDPRRSFTVEGRYNEFADETDNRLNFSFADKYFDETFGFILTATKDTQNTRTDRINTNWEAGAVPIADMMDSNIDARHARDLETGKAIRILGYQYDENGNVLMDENGNPLYQSIDSLEGYDPETQIVHQGDLWVLARDAMNMSLSQNERDRTTVSAGFQLRPTDDLDIQLDLTATQQDIYTDYNALNMNISPEQPLIYHGDNNLDWNTVDLANNTLVASRSRSIAGGLVRSKGLREVDTNVASLKIDFMVTDDLQMNLTAGYSKTTDETPDQTSPDRFITMNTATWGTTGQEVINGMPADIIEPAGYDCSNGGICSFFTGTTPAQFDALDGTVNSATSRFNPFDLHANHLNRFTFRNNKLDDTSKSLFLDFDYELDGDYFTSVEFGAKWTKRNKNVHVQNLIIENGDADQLGSDDPDTALETKGMGTIVVADILADEQYPYNDFAEGLDVDRNAAIFGGWPLLDADKALREFTQLDDASGIRALEDIAGSREIETETKAIYFKVNFEALDGRLTGNLGLRYVEDTNTATGVGGIQYPSHFRFLDPYNLLVERDLGNMSLDPCPVAVQQVIEGDSGHKYAPVNADELTGCWAWQVTHAYNKNNDETTPYDPATGVWLIPGANGEVGPDVNRLVFKDPNTGELVINQLPSQIYDQNGNLVSVTARDWLHFHADGHIWPFWDLSTSTTNPLYATYGTRMFNRTAMVTQSNTTDLLLPSLNLNYAFNEEMIGRFAVSKTMTRPEFDHLNPRVSVRETSFGAAVGTAGNAMLEPLESTNIDISYEWYFNESGMISTALFHKKMEGFIEQAVLPYHYRDVRTDYELESADLLLPFDANREVGDSDDCHPHRPYGGFLDIWEITCDVANVTTVRNGKSSEISGFEFGYTQNYDFLPGWFSGLGASFNYTYQDSEFEAEIVEGFELKPLPIANTPKHAANTTLYWEHEGTQFRLAHRYTGTQLIQRGGNGGALWQDETNRLDFSASIKLTDSLSLTLQALNLTDENRRNFTTAANTRIAGVQDADVVVLDEGSVLDDSSITTDRTTAVFKTGRQFRIGLRGSF